MRDLAVIQGAGLPSPTGDWAVLDRLETRRQNLLRRLTTPLGALWYDPAYGNEAYRILSQPATSAWMQRLELSCRRAVEQEPGARVTSLTVQQDGARILVRVAVNWDDDVPDLLQVTL